MKLLIAAFLALSFLIGMAFVFGNAFGWPGVLIVTAIFTLLCLFYFYRTMRLLSAIQAAPEGRTLHAEYFHKHIREGMDITKVVQIAQALGKKVSDNPSIYTWEDNLNRVTVTFENKKASQIEIMPIPPMQESTQEP